MEIKDFICQCCNCGAVLIDQNPQIDAPEIELVGDELEMEFLNDGTDEEPNFFWACPNCLTDDYLSDTVER